jgi:hypothetical protein
MQNYSLHHVNMLPRRGVAQLLSTAHSIPLSALAQFVRERLMARMPQRLEARAERKAQRPAKSRRRKKPTSKRPAARKAAKA